MSAKQIVDIAQAMIAKHGNKAAVIMQERAEHYRRQVIEKAPPCGRRSQKQCVPF